MLCPIRVALLAAALALPAAAAAQPAPTLLENYGRVVALLEYMTVHVGELLMACAAKNALTDAEAEARYQAYRKRNAALLERAESWRRQTERRLEAQGEARAAQELADRSGANATAIASMRAQVLIDKASDARRACEALLAAIESGRYDLSVNAEFVGLMKTSP